MKHREMKKVFVSVLLSASLAVSGIGFTPANISYAAAKPVAVESAAKVQWVMSTEQKPWEKQDDLQLVTSEEGAETQNLTIEVEEEKTYQELAADIWGGRFSESGWDELCKLSDGDKKAVLDLLFDPDSEEGLHLNMGRIPIGSSDYASEWYSLADTKDDYEMADFSISRDAKLIAYIKEALKRNPDMRLWASPWSPPAWMKDNNSLVGGNFVNGDNNKNMEAYALYFQKFVQAYEEQGIEIDMVVPQNEPFEAANTTGHPSCHWTTEQLSVFIKDYLGPKMQELGVEIYLGNFNTPDDDVFAPILNDMDVRKYVSGINFQRWAYNKVRAMYGVGYKQDMMQSGIIVGDGKNTWEYAENRFDGMWMYFSNGVSSYNLNNMVLPEGGGNTSSTVAQNSPITVDGTAKTFTKTPQYYQVKHFTEFVKAGARRIESGGTYDMPYVIDGNSDKTEDSVYAAELREIAFRNVDGTLAVLVKNGSSEEKTVEIRFGSKQVTAKLPAHSISTFTTQGTPLNGAETDQTEFVPQSELVKLENQQTITGANSSTGVLCTNGGVRAGVAVLRWGYGGRLNQLWYIKKIAEDSEKVKIVNAKSFNVLTIMNANVHGAGLLLQPEQENNELQEWILEETDGEVRIKSAKSQNEYLAFVNSNFDGAAIMWTWDAGSENADKRWKMEKVFADRPAVTDVTVTPGTVSGLKREQTQQFTGTVTADDNWTGEGSLGTVTWTVEGNQDVKTTITRTGLLKIGADETAEKVVVRASSTFDKTKTVRVEVPVIQPKINSVTVEPTAPKVQKGTQRQFKATVAADTEADTTVLWSVAGADKEDTRISESGLLTVASDETAATLTVTAVSVADETKKGTAAVTVTTEANTEPEVDYVEVSPDEATVKTGGTQEFTAEVSGVNLTQEHKKTTWAVSGNASQDTKIDAEGVLNVAEDETAETFTVTATSVTDQTKKGTAAVTVEASGADPDPVKKVTSVVITQKPTEVEKGKTAEFAAEVRGENLTDADKKVSWSVSGNSSEETAISEAGVLSVSLNETAEKLTVTATSAFDESKEATAEITVKEEQTTPGSDKEVTSVAITQKPTEVEKGKTAEFAAEVRGENLTDADKKVSWSVSGNSSEETAISEAGVLSVSLNETAEKLTVTATSAFDESKEATAEITVKEEQTTPGSDKEVTSVAITQKPTEVEKGKTAEFAAEVRGENLTDADKKVNWSVSGNASEETTISETGILSVSSDETAEKLTVTAASKLDESKKDTAEIMVKEAGITPGSEKEVTGVSIAPKTAVIEAGKTQQFTAQVSGKNLTDADKKVNWSVSGNKSSKTVVSAAGLLSVSSDETAEKLTVTATSTLDSSKKDTAEVTVKRNNAPAVPKKNSLHKIGKFQYKVTKSAAKNGTVELKKPLKKTNTSVSIPATVKINGYVFKVTSIGSKAFYKNTKLKTVKIGNNVVKIGASAFASNKKLTTVTMGKGITSIESKAFYQDAKLKKVTLKSSKLKTVKKLAFKGIAKNAKIDVPNKKAKSYKKLLKKAGLPAKASVK